MRLKEERIRLGFTERTGFVRQAFILSKGRYQPFNYEDSCLVPDADYLFALFKIGVDVQYIVTGVRSTFLSLDECNLLTLYRNDPLLIKKALISALEGTCENGGSVS